MTRPNFIPFITIIVTVIIVVIVIAFIALLFLSSLSSSSLLFGIRTSELLVLSKLILLVPVCWCTLKT